MAGATARPGHLSEVLEAVFATQLAFDVQFDLARFAVEVSLRSQLSLLAEGRDYTVETHESSWDTSQMVL